jgi:hypothetical protein
MSVNGDHQILLIQSRRFAMKFVRRKMGKMVSLKEKIRVASGEGMVDLLIKNGRVVDVLSD